MLRRPGRSIARSLRRIREARGLTLRQLAAQCGVSYLKLHYFEHGLRPTRNELHKVADALHCAPSELEGRRER